MIALTGPSGLIASGYPRSSGTMSAPRIDRQPGQSDGTCSADVHAGTTRRSDWASGSTITWVPSQVPSPGSYTSSVASNTAAGRSPAGRWPALASWMVHSSGVDGSGQPNALGDGRYVSLGAKRGSISP